MKYNKIIECTISNGVEAHKDSALLVCSDENFESIDIINDFFFLYSTILWQKILFCYSKAISHLVLK